MHGWHKRCQGLVCDVRERSTVDHVFARARERWGEIDIVVKFVPALLLLSDRREGGTEGLLMEGERGCGADSCTGYGIIGACEDQDEHDIRAQFETNVTGLVNIVQATLPYFRGRGSGRYIIFSSLYGLVSAPGLGRGLPIPPR